MQRSISEPSSQAQEVSTDSNQVPNLGRRSLPRPTSSGFFSFLRWFKKDDKDLNTDSEDENLSRPVSPLFSSNESVNSIFSTATATSFAYVPPNIYKPFGTASQPETLIAPGPDTETYRKRLRQRERLKELDRNLTLRKKYRLYAADTLRKNDRIDLSDPKKIKTENNGNYCDLSLPITRVSDINTSANGSVVKGHRRTASDSSKDKRAGAYVHVKGKRRAPPPPKYNGSKQTNSQSRSSTISRKKRPAPPPPIELKNEDTKPNNFNNMDNPKDPSDIPKDDAIANDSLKLEKGVLKPSKSIIIKEDMSLGKEIKDVPPVSPRPWYKRTGGNSKDFKKDKPLDKSKDKENTAFPEVNYYRSSTASDYNPRFSFFSKLNDKSDDKKKDSEKRKSGLSMLANISELDREAAAIVNSQREQSQNDEFDEIPSFLRPHVPEKEDENGPKSARDLISKFNAITNVTKVTVNSAFFNPKESAKLFPKNVNKPPTAYFLQNSDLLGTSSKTSPAQESETPPMKRSIFSTSGFTKPAPNLTSVDDIESKLNAGIPMNRTSNSPKLEKQEINDNLDNEFPKKFPMKSQSSVNLNSSINWTCKNCSAQNPHWKSTCTSCNVSKDNINDGKLNAKITDSPKSRKRTLGDWEKELKKYFPTKTRNSLCDLKKSSSDRSIFKPINENVNKNVLNKNKEVYQLHETKKMDVNNLNISTNKEFKPINDNAANKMFIKPNMEFNNDSSLNKTFVKPNMEEVRKIRLERFSANLDDIAPIPNRDENELEQSRLFERLREMKNSLPKQHIPPRKPVTPEPKIINKPENILHTAQNFKDDAKIFPKDDTNKFGAIKKTQVFNEPETAKEPEMSVYVVTTHTEFDDIKVRNENANKPLKVSSSCQTSGVIRKLEPTNKPPTIIETILPIMPENYQAPELKIRNRTYELIQARDFVSMNNAKINPIYQKPKNPYISQSKVASAEKGHMHTSDYDVLTEDLRIPKSIMKNRDTANNNNNTVEINKLLKSLENAIADGRQMNAARLAKDLANLKVNCSVIRQQNQNSSPKGGGPVIVTLDLYVEDKLSHQGPILLQIPKCMTLLGLKRKILHDFEIPIAIQRWILGNQLATDDSRTLEEYGIRESSAPIYLYLVAPEDDKEGPSKDNKIIVSGPNLIPDIKRNYSNLSDIKEMDSRSISGSEFSLNDTDCFDISEYSCNGLTDEVADIQNKQKLDWTCTTCTVNNYNLNENCTVCNSEKPTVEQKKQLESLKDEHYMQLLNLDSKDIVSNLEPFACSVCFDNFVVGEGVVLRECLHTFCRECLTNTIKYSEEPEVKCPFRNDQYTCNYVLQEREIKALVSKEIYEQHLAKSIAQAENKIKNAFHCKTPNCLGWCIFEDNVNLFHCPVCSHSNCLTCQAIHTNLDCRQYQEKMRQDSETNADAKRTKDMLKDLVDKGEAMTCPTCQVILMKKWGCDWLRCSMCKTEICWVTRGPRWGPNGKGDTSAGCRCGINGKKCHAKCNYCH